MISRNVVIRPRIAPGTISTLRVIKASVAMMKLWLTLLLAAALVAIPSRGGIKAAPGPQILTEQDRGRTLTLRLGERLVLNLRNPASGGYQVMPPVFDNSRLKLVSQKQLPPDPRPVPLAGDFGRLSYEWEAVGSGEADIQIMIYRPWEQKPPEEFWRVRVRVNQGKE